jgi:hypothetical protein
MLPSEVMVSSVNPDPAASKVQLVMPPPVISSLAIAEKCTFELRDGWRKSHTQIQKTIRSDFSASKK